jgi:hypothetical protein
MIGYVESLERLGLPLERELAIDLILQSLPESFSHFVMNFLLNDMDKQTSAITCSYVKNF